ncbi:hypothetical protein GCM10011510_04500 [Streptococcus himalayensis]|uniref:Uncharacterized protein n=1 Tax=Streptococcus himalayensis TaxID=1888195 RepID=A0A917ED88_9STRE|nr:hypothetical protein GCM10011510_04500 [Streptococcus himalayensis]
MQLFLKLVLISACLFLSLIIGYADKQSFKANRVEKIAWLLVDAYILILLYAVYRLIGG